MILAIVGLFAIDLFDIQEVDGRQGHTVTVRSMMWTQVINKNERPKCSSPDAVNGPLPRNIHRALHGYP